uniref:Uncharacterized protein n=1 Tax=Arundo donax TaxID=35708 RepID=A0A0A9FDH6_ARUDO
MGIMFRRMWMLS